MQKLYFRQLSDEEKKMVIKSNDKMRNVGRHCYSEEMIELIGEELEGLKPYFKSWSVGQCDRNNHITPYTQDVEEIRDFLEELHDKQGYMFYSSELEQYIESVLTDVEDYNIIENVKDECHGEYLLDETTDTMATLKHHIEVDCKKICTNYILESYRKVLDDECLHDENVEDYIINTEMFDDNVYIVVNEDNVYHEGDVLNENINAYKDVSYTVDMNDGVHYHN